MPQIDRMRDEAMRAISQFSTHFFCVVHRVRTNSISNKCLVLRHIRAFTQLRHTHIHLTPNNSRNVSAMEKQHEKWKENKESDDGTDPSRWINDFFFGACTVRWSSSAVKSTMCALDSLNEFLTRKQRLQFIDSPHIFTLTSASEFGVSVLAEINHTI